MDRNYFFMLICLFWIACGGKTKTSLEGTYVNESAGSYSRAFDTLLITREALDGNVYAVDRSVSFNRIRHGKLQSRDYHMEHWIGIFDDRAQTLTDTKKGGCSFMSPERKGCSSAILFI